ncbi:hypothetical protein ALP40_00933 [Pseudomonas viridiflava]|uniref:Uncharacterized protein n=1 Tax=Pseudomonas viridiflava TaxID=33069 RepID=A0A3M5P704_PSEVI|nr:hypothetical protein ALP40_00933 [Pseudomonas viridiflava]
MNEEDWKHLNALREVAVERLFDRIFENLQQSIQAHEKPGVRRYWLQRRL